MRNNREVELEIISQPSRQQICDRLRQQPGWDILFYAGHNNSHAEKGWLSINATTKLEISDFSAALSFLKQADELTKYNYEVRRKDFDCDFCLFDFKQSPGMAEKN